MSEKFWNKSRWTVMRQPNRGHATGRRTVQTTLTSTFQAKLANFLKKSRWTVTRQWSEVTRPSADCRTSSFDVSNKLEIFSKKSLNGHATVVGGQATVSWLSTNVYFDVSSKNGENFEKSRWTVTRQSIGGQATVRPTVKQLVFRRFKRKWQKNFKKSRWTVTRLSSDGHATVGWFVKHF